MMAYLEEKKPEHEDSSVRRRAVEAFVDWSKSTSFHGYPNIFRTKRITLKLMWIICFTISNAFCSYMIVKSMLEYLEYGVNTQIRVVNQIPMT
jgi:hypothetical protein